MMMMMEEKWTAWLIVARLATTRRTPRCECWCLQVRFYRSMSSAMIERQSVRMPRNECIGKRRQSLEMEIAIAFAKTDHRARMRTRPRTDNKSTRLSSPNRPKLTKLLASAAGIRFACGSQTMGCQSGTAPNSVTFAPVDHSESPQSFVDKIQI